MMMKNYAIIVLFVLNAFLSCQPHKTPDDPNIILIMADDMGYECLSCYGSTSYQTPNLDDIASKGIQFLNCVSQPLCTPSRVKIMTGKFNYRNYEHFGYLNEDEYTFGNLMQDAGYSTCIVGKWQLNGLAYKDKIPDWNDVTRPNQMGFDEYCLWQLTKTRGEGERFADPLIEQNGEVLQTSIDDYGPEIFTRYLLDFIERKKDEKFFAYFPMVLVHEPLVPTPDSKSWADSTRRYEKDTAYFKDMVEYTDKIVGQIRGKLRELGIEDNTLLIFTGDNGTHPTIQTQTTYGAINGGKGNTIDAGTHVPLIAYWPNSIKNARPFEQLIEFSDFFPTFAEIVDRDVDSDGHSFLPLLTGAKYTPRETAFVHYDPQWGRFVNQYRNQFVRTLDYKLYQDGLFYDLNADLLEENPLDADILNAGQRETREKLETELQKHPEWKTEK